MTNTLRLMTAIATFVTGPLAPNQTSAFDHQPAPAVVTVGMTTDEQDAVARTVALFAEAGLQLPTLTIRRHHDMAGCNGHEGLHRIDGEASMIDICTTTSGESEQRTILHELSHAWAFHYLTPEHKEAFKQLRGWEHWLDYDSAEWEDNGAEQAAEIMVWALSDHPVQVIKIDGNTCAALHDGYSALTGLEPLHGYTDRCDPTSHVRVRVS
jgi:hypothetical protein